MCGPKFCSMEITQQARDYAAKLDEKATLSSSEVTLTLRDVRFSLGGQKKRDAGACQRS